MRRVLGMIDTYLYEEPRDDRRMGSGNRRRDGIVVICYASTVSRPVVWTRAAPMDTTLTIGYKQSVNSEESSEENDAL